MKIDMRGSGGSGEFEVLDNGTYDATVFEITLKDTKPKADDPPNAPKTQYLNWQFSLKGEGHEGRRVFAVTSLKVTALWKLRETLTALGIDMPEGDDALENFELNPQDIVGTRCRLLLGQSVYNGTPKNEVKKVLPGGAEGEEESGALFGG